VCRKGAREVQRGNGRVVGRLRREGGAEVAALGRGGRLVLFWRESRNCTMRSMRPMAFGKGAAGMRGALAGRVAQRAVAGSANTLVQGARGFAEAQEMNKDGSPVWLPDPELIDRSKPQLFTKRKRANWECGPRRAGLIALKIGMMPGWDVYGARYPLTVLQVDSNFVTQVKTKAKDGVNAVQVGAVDGKDKHVTKPIRKHCEKAGVSPKKIFMEFQVAEEGLLEAGTELTCQHFVPGQFVDIQGTSLGKGFQGGMKKWGFKGQPASHGVSKAHRSLGSMGASQDPGRILPGKKMAGRMGNKKRTVQNLWIFRLDTARNLIYVAGHVPGPKGRYVRIIDAKKRTGTLHNGMPLKLPWPTYTPTPEDAEKGPIINAPIPKKNYLDPSVTPLDPATFVEGTEITPEAA